MGADGEAAAALGLLSNYNGLLHSHGNTNDHNNLTVGPSNDMPLAPPTTTHHHIPDYNGGRTFAEGDVPPPPEPSLVQPLCHNRVTGPPDFGL